MNTLITLSILYAFGYVIIVFLANTQLLYKDVWSRIGFAIYLLIYPYLLLVTLWRDVKWQMSLPTK